MCRRATKFVLECRDELRERSGLLAREDDSRGERGLGRHLILRSSIEDLALDMAAGAVLLRRAASLLAAARRALDGPVAEQRIRDVVGDASR
jgi:hypothetical protein